MQEQVGRYRPGNTISVEYYRGGKKHSAKVVLKNKANGTSLVTQKNEDILIELGFELRNLTREEKRRLDVDGIKVVSIYRGSRIERTNMDPGFIITKMDNRPVKSVEAFLDGLKNATGKVMLEGVYESYPGEYYYAFPVD